MINTVNKNRNINSWPVTEQDTNCDVLLVHDLLPRPPPASLLSVLALDEHCEAQNHVWHVIETKFHVLGLTLVQA